MKDFNTKKVAIKLKRAKLSLLKNWKTKQEIFAIFQVNYTIFAAKIDCSF